MASKLTKPVARLSEERIRDAGKTRRLVITVYPAGFIGLRPERTRREEIIPIDHVYFNAVKARVASEQAAKRAKRKGGK